MDSKMTTGKSNVTPGIFVVEIVSREPSEAKIVHVTHPSIEQTPELNTVSNWKSFNLPVCFSVMGSYEMSVRAVATASKIELNYETATVYLKQNASRQQLKISFDSDKSLTFEIEYTWKPLTINKPVISSDVRFFNKTNQVESQVFTRLLLLLPCYNIVLVWIVTRPSSFFSFLHS
jgi:hypothetical protein